MSSCALKLRIYHINTKDYQKMYNNSMVQQPTEGQSLPTDCFPHFHMPADRSDVQPPCLWVMCGQYVEISTVEFLHCDCRYRSVSTLIPHDAILVLNPFTGRKCLPDWSKTSAACRRSSWVKNAWMQGNKHQVANPTKENSRNMCSRIVRTQHHE